MTITWDESGTHVYETGVDQGILFPRVSPAVPWNGLVQVSVDVSGGESESYYYDGTKYMDRVLSEDFQATISAISTPPEFAAIEGVASPKPGMYRPFGQRKKFDLVWRTQIGSDIDQDLGYKLHIAYNCLVMPSQRSYGTLSDSMTPDIRQFVVKTTPACGLWSYYWFDSRECDLSELEALLLAGTLPVCYELTGLIGAPGGGGGPEDPDEGCLNFIEDYERYVHGQTVSESVDADILGDASFEESVYGLINNGLDIIELPASGAFEDNDSAATETGTHPVLTDADDATYIGSADGDLGYTIALPPLVGYVEGAALELHIRMSISGDVSEDDPDNIDADAQVHISTDNTGDTTIGGFSDGTDEGMGFALEVVDGTPVDYVIPLSMDAWIDTSLEDVVTALEAGAYLNVVGVSNNNPDTTPEVRVYEASVVMLNDTDPDKWLRSPAPDDNNGRSTVIIHDGGPALVNSHSTYVDFKVMEAVWDTDADGEVSDVITYVDSTGGEPGMLRVEMDTSLVKVKLYDTTGGSVLATIDPTIGAWYQARIDFGYADARVRVYLRESPSTLLIDETIDVSSLDPMIWVKFYAKFVGDGDKSYEVGIDNERVQVHCNDVPSEAPWTCFDLSTAVFFSSSEDTNMEGQYVAPVIKSKLDSTSFSRHAQFHFPGFTLDPTKTYEFKAVYAAHTYGMGIYQQNPSWESTFWSDNDELASTFADTDGDNTVIVTVGPGISDWDQAITDDYQTLIRFDMSTNGDTGTVDGANLVSLCYREA